MEERRSSVAVIASEDVVSFMFKMGKNQLVHTDEMGISVLASAAHEVGSLRVRNEKVRP